MTAPTYDDLVTRADLTGLPGIPTGDGEELQQPPMVVAVSPDGEQVVPMTRKAFTNGVGRDGWTELEPDDVPATRSRSRATKATAQTTPAPAGGDT